MHSGGPFCPPLQIGIALVAMANAVASLFVASEEKPTRNECKLRDLQLPCTKKEKTRPDLDKAGSALGVSC